MSDNPDIETRVDQPYAAIPVTVTDDPVIEGAETSEGPMVFDPMRLTDGIET